MIYALIIILCEPFFSLGFQITEMATAHFEKPVDTTHFPDYRKYVECPMDLETVDGKIDRDEYVTPEGTE